MYYLFLSFCNKYTTQTGKCQVVILHKFRSENLCNLLIDKILARNASGGLDEKCEVSHLAQFTPFDIQFGTVTASLLATP